MAINFQVPNNLREGVGMPTLQNIADIFDLSYGILNGAYVLKRDELSDDGNYTVMYDAQRIGRGFEIGRYANYFDISLPFPSTKHDIKLVYDVIEYLCRELNTEFFYQDEEKVSLRYLEYSRDGAEDASQNALFNMRDAIYSGDSEKHYIFSALNPICIGKKEIEYIGASLDGLEDFLDMTQKWDVFYPTMRFYKMQNNENAFVTIYIADSTPTVIPNEAKMAWKMDFEVEKWFFTTPVRNSLIPFDDLIKNVEKLDDYDNDHIIVSLDEEKINSLLRSYNYTFDTDDYTPIYYWGRYLDDSEKHSKKITDKGLDTEYERGANHLAVYLRYAAVNNLLSHDFKAMVSAEVIEQISASVEGARKRLLEDNFITKELYTRYFEPNFANKNP